jgi:hypothetical protein
MAAETGAERHATLRQMELVSGNWGEPISRDQRALRETGRSLQPATGRVQSQKGTDQAAIVPSIGARPVTRRVLPSGACVGAHAGTPRRAPRPAAVPSRGGSL